MHGFMPVDRNGKPLMRQMIWADGRAGREANSLDQKLGGLKIHRRTGCMPTALYYPARLRWLSKNSPKLFKQADKFVSLKDAIIARLIGRWVVDKSHASSNGLLNIARLKWDKTMLDAAGISEEKLPELVEPDEIAGKLSEKAAQLLGLKKGTPVAAGAGDGGLANLGSGAIEPGSVAATIGSSGAMRKIFNAPWTAPGGKIWCYYLASDLWYAGGAINSGGIILRWLRDGLLAPVRDQAMAQGIEPYSKIIKLAESVPAGADGLLFLPYLFGERTPYWNPLAKGVLFGLGPQHNQAHIARATLEGITMCMAHVFEYLKKSPGPVSEVRASGGFARSDFWLQLMADMTGAPVSLPLVRENSAMGAAILAMKAAGALKSFAGVRRMIKVKKVFRPDKRRTAFYRERLEMFKDLYNHLEKDFARWSQISSK